MERSLPESVPTGGRRRAIAASSVGFVAATAFADPGDPVDEVRQMHAEMHATQGGMGMHPDAGEVDEMCARLSPEDRARHERMHEACRGLMTERREG